MRAILTIVSHDADVQVSAYDVIVVDAATSHIASAPRLAEDVAAFVPVFPPGTRAKTLLASDQSQIERTPFFLASLCSLLHDFFQQSAVACYGPSPAPLASSKPRLLGPIEPMGAILTALLLLGRLGSAFCHLFKMMADLLFGAAKLPKSLLDLLDGRQGLCVLECVVVLFHGG